MQSFERSTVKVHQENAASSAALVDRECQMQQAQYRNEKKQQHSTETNLMTGFFMRQIINCIRKSNYLHITMLIMH